MYPIRIFFAVTLAGILAGETGRPLRAPVREVIEDYHGTKVADPYRWMEDTSTSEFTAWLKNQAEFTRDTISQIRGRDRLVAQLNEFSGAVELILQPVRRGNLYFYLKLLPNEDVYKLYVREGLNSAERVLADPARKAAVGVHYSIDYYEPSPDGKYVAYGESPGGSENSVLRIVETATGRDLGEAIDRTMNALPQWQPDGHSFFYMRAQKSASKAPVARRFNPSHYLHVLGRNPDEDPIVLGRGLNTAVDFVETDYPRVLVPLGSKYAIGLVSHGVRHEVTAYIAPLDSVKGPGTPWRKVADVVDAVTKSIAVFGDAIYLLSHRDAPRFKLLRTSASNPDLAHAEVVVPQAKAVLTDFAIAEDAIYVHMLDGGIGRLLRIRHVPGASPEPIALPFEGSISSLWADPRRPGAMFILESWTRTPRLYTYDPERQILADTGLQPPNPANMSRYDSAEVKVKSHDGTLVPLSIVYRKGLPRDGSHPALLEGYGAYGTTLSPHFMAIMLPWLERGGIYAVAHARGGGEYGENWHLAGKMQTKHNTFLDGIACAHYLIENRYTTAKKLAITGASAGGIFAGGAITERPNLFGAAIIRVGVSDMLRIETAQFGPMNTLEFGSFKTSDGFRALLAMSPYHRVKDAVPYPAVLLTTGINDPRVPSWEPSKMAARLQAATSSRRPVLLRVDYDAGHGRGRTRTQFVQEWADSFAFLLWQLGEKDFQPAGK